MIDPYYIYFITANPPDTLPTKATHLIQEIINVVERDVRRKPPARPVKFQIGAHAARWGDVMKQLMNFRQEVGKMPDLIHMVCHGYDKEDITLAFEDKEVNGHMLSGFLAGIQNYDPGAVKALVLTACHSDGLAESVVQNEELTIPLAVGAISDLGVAKAREWCSGFYLALCHGDTFKKAFQMGMTTVKMQLGQEPPKMVMMERNSGVDAERVIFPLTSDTPLPDPIAGMFERRENQLWSF